MAINECRMVLTGNAWERKPDSNFSLCMEEISQQIEIIRAGGIETEIQYHGRHVEVEICASLLLNIRRPRRVRVELAEQPDQSPPYFEGKCEAFTLKGGMPFSEDVWFKELSPDDWWEKYDNRIELAESKEEERSKKAKRNFDMTFGVWSHPRSGRRYSEKSDQLYDRPASLNEDEDTSQVNMLDDETGEALVPVTYVKMAEVFNIEREKLLNDLHTKLEVTTMI